MLHLAQFERECRTIRVYQPHLIPGVLQTPEYADSVLAWWKSDLSVEERRVRYEFRMSRRRDVIEDDAAPEYFLVLDEVVLKRRVGGAAGIMAAQLEDLARTAGRPNVHLRVMEIEKGGTVGTLGPFTLLDVGHGETEDAVVYREYDLRDDLVDDPAQVERFGSAYERIWKLSLDEKKSLHRINAEAAHLRSISD